MSVVGHVPHFANMVSFTAASSSGNRVKTRVMVGANIQWKLLGRQQVSDGEQELFHIHALGVRISRIATDTMSTDSVEPMDGHAGNSAQGCPAC